MRATFVAAGACAVLALAGVSGCGSQEESGGTPTPAEARTALAGAPASLASLHRQSAELLDGGMPAYAERIASLRGRPVVVNAWASWCDPCRYEMAYFSRAAVRFGRRVAFVGVNSEDSRSDARGFLDRHWIPFPSYVDPRGEIADAIGVRTGLPTTVFYARDGEIAYVKQGQYRDEAQLVADVKRYAGAS